MNQTKMMQKAILQSNPKVATHTCDGKKRKITDTSNVNLQQKLLSNQTLPIITTTIDHPIPDRVANFGGTPHALTTSTTNGVITDTLRNRARILWTPGRISRTGRDGTTLCDRDVVLRSPWDNRPVLIGGIIVPPTMGDTGIQDIIKKRKSTSPRVTSNAQNFDASVDGNMTGILWPFSAKYWV